MMEERATYQTNRQRHELPPGTLLEYSDPRYQKPTGDDVRELLSRADLSGSQAAKLVGAGSSRTVRKWVGDESPIGYAAWRLILIYAGIVEPQRKSDSAAGIAAERK